jgi:hypothetical protein
VGRVIALLFHDHGTRRGWVVSSIPRPYFTPGKDPVPIVQETGWARGLVWTGGKSRPTGIRSPDRPARSHSLYRLSYPAHNFIRYYPIICLERIKQTTRMQNCLPPGRELKLGNPKSRYKTAHSNSFSVTIRLQKAIRILLGSHTNKTTTTFVDKLDGE